MTPNTFKHEDRNATSETDGEALLQSEIDFWLDIIETSPVTQSSESIERMHQAMGLAESRLEKLRAESRAMALLASREH